MSEGWVYIASIPTFSEKNLYKIGRTTISPEERARQLSQATGVPEEFKVVFSCDVSDCALAEDMVHERLKLRRYKENKEFFEVPLDIAQEVVRQVANEIGASLKFEKDINAQNIASYLSLKFRDRETSNHTEYAMLADNLNANNYNKIRDVDRLIERSRTALREFERHHIKRKRFGQVRAVRISLELCDPGFHKRIQAKLPIREGFGLFDMYKPFRKFLI